jgi:hypothetical protein
MLQSPLHGSLRAVGTDRSAPIGARETMTIDSIAYSPMTYKEDCASWVLFIIFVSGMSHALPTARDGFVCAVFALEFTIRRLPF